MSRPIIEVSNLTKRYQLGAVGSTTLREDMARTWRRLRGKPSAEPERGEFWALRDVSFEVPAGQVVGIIGRNGAGKSTLLKILSRITEPTSGRAVLRGRIASLLEVGTGFHPDLTGRENIYLNGSILGLRKHEITRRFDEIVAFAEVEQFIDTPVKHYSSGMHVRLAFAVAAHLEPEILIVDEVLAVGDMAFQTKCLVKMEDVSRKEGRTVLFVSHFMDSLRRLCQRVVLLEKGRVVEDSPDVHRVVDRYLARSAGSLAGDWNSASGVFQNPFFAPRRLWISAERGGPPLNHFAVNKDVWLNVAGHVETPNQATSVGLSILDEEQRPVFWTFHNDENSAAKTLRAGSAALAVRVPAFLLNEGRYRVELMAGLTFVRWLFGGPGDDCPVVEFKVNGGFTTSPYWIARRPGAVAPLLNWHYEA